MEQLMELLSQAGRAVQLELELTGDRFSRKELAATVSDKKVDRDWKVLEATNLERPNFFQRLSSKLPEKQEKARMEAQAAEAAYLAVRGELKALDRKMAAAQEELEALQGAGEAYAQAKQETLTEQLWEEQIQTFRPMAVLALKGMRKALADARPYMQNDALRTRRDGMNGRKLEFLQLADQYAAHLRGMLPYFPGEVADAFRGLESPSAYVTGLVSDYGQLDRLNLAVEQTKKIQKLLETL